MTTENQNDKKTFLEKPIKTLRDRNVSVSVWGNGSYTISKGYQQNEKWINRNVVFSNYEIGKLYLLLKQLKDE